MTTPSAGPAACAEELPGWPAARRLALPTGGIYPYRPLDGLGPDPVSALSLRVDPGEERGATAPPALTRDHSTDHRFAEYLDPLVAADRA